MTVAPEVQQELLILMTSNPSRCHQPNGGDFSDLGEPAVTELVLYWLAPLQIMDKITLENPSDEEVDSR